MLACEPGAYAFIERHFHDCIYSEKELAGFCLGLASLCAWIVAQMPQYISNYKNQSAEALSPWFLLQLFLGDTLNLLGCLVQGQQLSTTVYLAMYFVLADVIMLFQIVYYGALQKRKQRHRQLRKEASLLKRSHRRSLRHGLSTQSSLATQMSIDDSLWVNDWATRNTFRPTLPPLGASDHTPCDSPRQHAPALQQLQQHLQQGLQQVVVSNEVPVLQAPPRREVARPAGDTLAAAPNASSVQAACAVAASALTLISFSALRTRGESGSPVMASGMPFAMNAMQAPIPGSAAGGPHGGGGTSLGTMSLPGCSDRSNEPWWCDEAQLQMLAGTAMGYAAAILYVGSRLPQIYKNYVRKSAEGLALGMFCLMFFANSCTGMSILLRLETWEAFKVQLPWLVGSWSTVTLDMIIAFQTVTYNAAKPPPPLSRRASAALQSGDPNLSSSRRMSRDGRGVRASRDGTPGDGRGVRASRDGRGVRCSLPGQSLKEPLLPPTEV